MAARDHLDQLLRAFGAEIGLGGLALDADGYAVLGIDDRLVINIELDEAGGGFLLYSFLGVPQGDERDTFAQLLAANYLNRGTEGATLGLQVESGGIVLSQPVRLHPAMTLAELVDLLDRFTALTESWTERLARADAPTHEPEPPAPGHGHIIG